MERWHMEHVPKLWSVINGSDDQLGIRIPRYDNRIAQRQTQTLSENLQAEITDCTESNSKCDTVTDRPHTGKQNWNRDQTVIDARNDYTGTERPSRASRRPYCPEQCLGADRMGTENDNSNQQDQEPREQQHQNRQLNEQLQTQTRTFCNCWSIQSLVIQAWRARELYETEELDVVTHSFRRKRQRKRQWKCVVCERESTAKNYRWTEP